MRDTGDIVSFGKQIAWESEKRINEVLELPELPINMSKAMDDSPDRKTTRPVIIVHWPPGSIATSNMP